MLYNKGVFLTRATCPSNVVRGFGPSLQDPRCQRSHRLECGQSPWQKETESRTTHNSSTPSDTCLLCSHLIGHIPLQGGGEVQIYHVRTCRTRNRMTALTCKIALQAGVLLTDLKMRPRHATSPGPPVAGLHGCAYQITYFPLIPAEFREVFVARVKYSVSTPPLSPLHQHLPPTALLTPVKVNFLFSLLSRLSLPSLCTTGRHGAACCSPRGNLRGAGECKPGLHGLFLGTTWQFLGNRMTCHRGILVALQVLCHIQEAPGET